jgi:DNA-binding SARP family transcriptional activator
MLSLTTLGGLCVTRAESDQPDARLQRRRLALLATLAAAGTRGLSRDRLLLLLWPEADAESARNNLKQGIYALRRDLGADALASDTQDLRLNSEVWACDRWTFETALAQGDLNRAVSVYTGPFLDGFHVGGESEEFERWADSERAALATAYREALQALADQADAARDFHAASRWWRRLAALEPLDGRVVLGLVNALALSGNAAGALQHARAHQELVRREVGIDPDPAVAALAERIRTGRLISPVGPADAGSSTGPAPAGAALSGSEVRRQAAPGRVGGGALRERLQAALAGRYTIEREPGGKWTGGPTRSFVARDERHGRTVILKAVHPTLASQLDVARFVREIGFTASLHHPHLVPLLDSGQVDGGPWFAVPDVAGESLRERLGRDLTVPAGEAVRLAVELADALDHAHRHGVVHRDVTPENVLLAEGHVYLTNLGVARAIAAAATARLTETGMLVGTPAYMSPEQASGESLVDGRSDVYSLGCVLFEMLAGEPLHSGPTPHVIMAKRRLDLSPRLMSLTSAPATLVAALRKALATQPADRFASAAELRAALRSVGLV